MQRLLLRRLTVAGEGVLGTRGRRKWTHRTVYSLELLDSFFFFSAWAGITYKKLMHHLSSKNKTINQAKAATENPTARDLGTKVQTGSA